MSYSSFYLLLGLDFRDPPAETRLTVYCWLHIHTRSIGTGNRAGHFYGLSDVKHEIGRDRVITFDRRSEMTKTYM